MRRQMGEPNIEHDAKLFCAVTYATDSIELSVVQRLVQNFGEIDFQSDMFDFNFTNYYTPEMGRGLKKQFYSFEKLIRPEHLNSIKLTSNQIESDYLQEVSRQVNIDPGYLTPAKVVLATTKNFSHRIYLGKGIYGDLHLRYMDGKYRPVDWTYADYKTELTQNFLMNIRKILLRDLKNR